VDEKPATDGERTPLHYAPVKARGGLMARAARSLGRINRPMSLGMTYFIMFVLGILGTLIAVAIAAIVRLLR